MQRDTSLLVGFAAGHLGAAHTAGYLYLDALGSHTHGRCDSGLHGTAVRYAAFELAGDVVGDNHRIHLRTLHLEDVYLHLLAGEFLKLFFQLVNFLAALADDDTGACGRDGNGDELQRPFYDNLRDTCLGQTGVQVFADFSILHQLGREVFPTVPVGVPAADYAEAVSYRIYFLSHLSSLFLRLSFYLLQS